jgi:hypothetical protein
VIDHYVGMLTDRYRIESFQRAIAEVVRPGDVVVEIGAGLGTYAFFAARSGAGKVYAIERGPIHRMLPALARDNGLGDRVEVIGSSAHRARLDRKADVLITEDFGPLFLSSDLHGILVGPRTRLLRRGGRVVPWRARVYFAPVECARVSSERDPWQRRWDGYDLDWGRIREMAVNEEHSVSLKHRQLLGPPRLFASVDTATLRPSSLTRTLSFSITRPGRLTGVAGWFEADLSPSVSLSNAPGTRGTVWGQGLFLLPTTPVVRGSRLEVRVSLLRDPWGNCFWGWAGTVRARRGQVNRFERSSFRALPMSRAAIRALSQEHVLDETPAVLADRFLLGLLGTGLPVRSLVERLHRRFPGEFPTEREAAQHVARVVERYE